MNRFFIFSCILCTCALQSQAQFAVNGMVADSTGTGEAYATLRIYNLADTTKAVRLGTTTEDGSFSQSLPKAGKYVINIIGRKITSEARFRDYKEHAGCQPRHSHHL